MTAAKTHQRPLTGRHMAMIFTAFFGVVVGVNITMATLASKSWTGLVVPNSYVASQKFNEVTAGREAILARGDRVQLQYENGQLKVALTDRTERSLQINSAELRLFHNVATSEKLLTLTCTDGKCTTDVELTPGFWRGDMRLNVRDIGQTEHAVEIFTGNK